MTSGTRGEHTIHHVHPHGGAFDDLPVRMTRERQVFWRSTRYAVRDLKCISKETNVSAELLSDPDEVEANGSAVR